jgi:flagellar protein FlbD
MIKVNKLDGTEYYVNPHQIECMEIRPDTVLVMLSGRTHIIRNEADDVLEKIETYRRRLSLFTSNPPVVQE